MAYKHFHVLGQHLGYIPGQICDFLAPRVNPTCFSDMSFQMLPFMVKRVQEFGTGRRKTYHHDGFPRQIIGVGQSRVHFARLKISVRHLKYVFRAINGLKLPHNPASPIACDGIEYVDHPAVFPYAYPPMNHVTSSQPTSPAFPCLSCPHTIGSSPCRHTRQDRRWCP